MAQLESSTQTKLDAKIDKTATTGSAAMPSGTTAERDASPVAGYFRWNSTLVQFEGWDGSTWGSIGGLTDGDYGDITVGGVSASL